MSETIVKVNELLRFRRIIEISKNHKVEIKIIPRNDNVSIYDPFIETTNKSIKHILELREKLLENITKNELPESDMLQLLSNYDKNILDLIGMF